MSDMEATTNDMMDPLEIKRRGSIDGEEAVSLISILSDDNNASEKNDSNSEDANQIIVEVLDESNDTNDGDQDMKATTIELYHSNDLNDMIAADGSIADNEMEGEASAISILHEDDIKSESFTTIDTEMPVEAILSEASTRTANSENDSKAFIRKFEFHEAGGGLLSTEKLDRASPDLWPEKIPGISDFIAMSDTPIREPKAEWTRGFSREDIDEMIEWSKKPPSQFFLEIKQLYDESYQLGLQESKEMTRGKYLGIFKNIKKKHS